MDKERRAIKKCAEWLAYCLEIGWSKEHLNALEKLWWEYHDKNGKVKNFFNQNK